ncbi:CARDB domain-containing protein, partial [Chloroflexota bacterium]
MTFTVTIKNQGGGQAGSSHVAYYIGGTFLMSAYVGSLIPSATTTKTFLWEAQTGSYTIEAVADSYSKVIESDEDNNAKAKTVAVSRFAPDLIIDTVTWSPESIFATHGIVFTVNIKNRGDIATGYSLLYFYVDNSLKGYEEIQSMDASANVTKTFTWTAQADSHAIKAVADGENHVPESNEANNTKTVTISSSSKPDLVVQDVAWSPESPSAGDNVTFTVTIKNRGGSKASSFPVACYADDVYLTSATINQMDPGVTATKTFFCEAQAHLHTQAGLHTVEAIVDYDQKVTESNENNNAKTVTFSILAPDLVIQNITWSPESPSAGDNVTFTVTIRNRGSGKASSSLVDFYIDDSSRDHNNVQEVDVSANVTKTFTWTAQAGSHAIKAVADVENQVYEDDESNNEKTVTVSASPPPAATPVSVPVPEPSPVSTPSPEQQGAIIHLSTQSSEVPVGRDIVLDLSAMNPATDKA